MTTVLIIIATIFGLWAGFRAGQIFALSLQGKPVNEIQELIINFRKKANNDYEQYLEDLSQIDAGLSVNPSAANTKKCLDERLARMEKYSNQMDQEKKELENILKKSL